MGAAFNCYTTTGSFSRSAIMDNVGACTQLAGIISGAPGVHLQWLRQHLWMSVVMHLALLGA